MSDSTKTNETALQQALRASSKVYAQRARSMDGRVSNDGSVLSGGHTMGEGTFIEPWAERKARRAREAAAAVKHRPPVGSTPTQRNGTHPILSLRADAKAAGAKHYFTGVRCGRGHLAERYVTDGKCVVCSRLNKRKSRARTMH